MKRIASFLAAAMPLAVGLAVTAPVYADTNVFPIMPWNWMPNDPVVLQRVRDCGFTVAGFVAPEALDNCRAAGLQAIVSDARTAEYDWSKVDAATARRNVSNLVAQVGRHPAVYGYYLRDEPGAALFPGLNVVASAVQELSPGKWPYINLFPDYASREQLGTATYAEHLEQFIATCHPRILSYDNYSLMDDGTVRENYWTNLEAVRAACRRHNVVFWNIVLGVAHFHYREPGPADLRFQAYTTLAYGGRGLSYFTYMAPAVGNYRAAAIDQFGHETPTWHHLQNVNLQVQKLGPTLLELTSDEVYHFGSVPKGCRAPSEQSLIAKLNGEFLVGDFTHRDGSRWTMVVNKDCSKSAVCAPQFRAPVRKLQQLSPYSGALGGFDGEQVWLAPGQGVLLKLER